ncbi:hypothetical protein ACRAWF_25115 [Streptomyces sp. L7]
MFADIALDHGASVTAVIPGMDYEAHLGGAEVRSAYRRILRSCAARALSARRTDARGGVLRRGPLDRGPLRPADRRSGTAARHAASGGTGDVVEYAWATGSAGHRGVAAGRAAGLIRPPGCGANPPFTDAN